MKKIKLLLMVLFIYVLGFSISNANYAVTSSNKGYNSPIIDGSIKFKAELKDGKVQTSWTKYNKNEGFKYYKVVRSQKVSNPVYPDNGYIKYSSDINFTEYVDYKVPVGLSYYRVCAITTEKNRYCSNVVKIVNKISDSVDSIPKTCVSWYDGCNTCFVNNGKIGGCTKMACFRQDTPKCLKYKDTEKAKVCTMEYAPVCGNKSGTKKTYSNKCMLEGAGAKYLYLGKCETTKGISDKLRKKADYIVIKFIKRIESKYSDNEKRIKILNLVVNRLNKLSKEKPKVKILVDYINKKFNQKILDYGNDMKDIENIFNQY